MKEVVTIEVKDGDSIQIYANEKPAGQKVTVPSGVTSITVILRDTEGVKAAQAKLKAKREAQTTGEGSGAGRSLQKCKCWTPRSP